MRITVDLDSATPQYEQIRAQVVALITSGALGEGDRLPTVRTLAADLGIAPGTVARAYRKLESAGQVATRRRVGTVVTAPTRSPAGPTRSPVSWSTPPAERASAAPTCWTWSAPRSWRRPPPGPPSERPGRAPHGARRPGGASRV